MKLVRFGLSLSIAIGMLALPGLASAYSGCGGVMVPVSNLDYEQQVVELVNAQRLANGSLPPYKRVDALDAAARYHAADLGQDDYFDHDSFDRVSGSLVQVCEWTSRVGTYYTGAGGENIAAGYATPAIVMDGWMNSPGHKANILGSAWEIGVGYFSGSGHYGRYWVQDFGKRSGVYPLVVNREAAVAASTSVSLYIYGTFNQVRLKNENGSWSAWQSFQNNLPWTLSPCNGIKTVTAELKTGANVITSSDSIYLASPSQVLCGTPTHSYYLPRIFH